MASLAFAASTATRAAKGNCPLIGMCGCSGRGRSGRLVSGHNHPVSEQWEQTITVTGLETGFTLYCEPEGAEQEVLPDDVLTLTFTAAEPHGFEISHVESGVVLCPLGDSEV